MKFTEIFGNVIFGSIFGFLGAMGFYEWFYFRFMPEKTQNRIDSFFCKLPNYFKSNKIRNTYIMIINKIDKIVNNKSIKKWESNNKELYNNTLYCISTLICLIPGFISFFKNPHFFILGPFLLGSYVFSQSVIFYKQKETFTKKKYFWLVFFAGGIYSMLSTIGFIFFKNETIGVGYCAACITTFLFGLYIYVFMRSIINTQIFIHKCSYGQNSKSLIKHNFRFFIKSLIICSFTLLIIWSISKLIYFVNLTGYKDLTILYESNKNYLFTSVVVYGLFIVLQILIIILFITYLFVSFCLYSLYLFTKVIAFKKIYIILISLALAYFSGIILIKYLYKNPISIQTETFTKTEETTTIPYEESGTSDEQKNITLQIDNIQETDTEQKTAEEDNNNIDETLEELIPLEDIFLPPLEN